VAMAQPENNVKSFL